MGTPNARVFPDPVWAAARMQFPSMAGFRVARWMGVGWRIPASANAFRMDGWMFADFQSSSKEKVGTIEAWDDFEMKRIKKNWKNGFLRLSYCN